MNAYTGVDDLAKVITELPLYEQLVIITGDGDARFAAVDMGSGTLRELDARLPEITKGGYNDLPLIPILRDGDGNRIIEGVPLDAELQVSVSTPGHRFTAHRKIRGLAEIPDLRGALQFALAGPVSLLAKDVSEYVADIPEGKVDVKDVSGGEF